MAIKINKVKNQGKDGGNSRGKFDFQGDKDDKDLILESFDTLIKRQENAVKKMGGDDDKEEIENLRRYNEHKKLIDKVTPVKEKDDKSSDNKPKDAKAERTGFSSSVIIEAPPPETVVSDHIPIDKRGRIDDDDGMNEVTYRTMYDLVNALNNHIFELEQKGTYQQDNKIKKKYDRLVQLLEEAQENKAMFERNTPSKPRGFGRLRR